MRVRPTLRGVTVAVLAGIAIGLAAVTGPRALNAVAAPALVALLAGGVHLFGADPVAIDRTPPPAGFPGDSRTVSLRIDGGTVVGVTEPVPDGVRTTDRSLRATLPATVEYEIELQERGEWTLGPPTVAETDVLGLLHRKTATDATTTVVVYPAVYDLREQAVAALFDHGTTSDRQSFDTVREYAPGDPLRDIHWKSSAKREPGEFVVKQFVADQYSDRFHIAASAAPGAADGMAAAAASLAVLALSTGLSVAVTCPAGTVRAGRGDTHRHQLLSLLARTGDGEVGEQVTRAADMTVRADSDGVTVTADGETYPLELGASRQDTARVSRATDGGQSR